MSGLLSLSLTVFFALLLRKYVASWKKHPPYPPGPKPKPFIGNILDFPTEDVPIAYVEWGKKYNSSILHASALGSHVIVLNKLEDANELFEKRARIYSDRPEYPIQKLMSWDHNVALMRYGEEWRYCRRICQEHFRKEAVKNYHSVISQKVHAMLDGLLQNPKDFEYHNKMLSVAITMKTMYGYDVESVSDPCITNADKSIALGSPLLVPGASMINIFPILGLIPAWFPGASSHKVAAEVKRLTDEVIRFPMNWANMRMREGNAIPSLVSNFLEKKNTIGVSAQEEKAIEDIAYTVHGAASDTTISATGSFLYFMAINHDIQEKAQREIDRVVGRHRLPDFSDRPTLPYLEAIYREVLRCRPPLNLGLPHSLTEDDHYKGYLIPKGTIVFSNIWAMTQDESVYLEPFAFKPERFFDKNGDLNDDDKILAYGFGRRGCVGRHVASATLWLTFTSLLATFNVERARDDAGNEIPISDEYKETGLITHKTPFECSIIPRSRGHRQLIEEMNILNK